MHNRADKNTPAKRFRRIAAAILLIALCAPFAISGDRVPLIASPKRLRANQSADFGNSGRAVPLFNNPQSAAFPVIVKGTATRPQSGAGRLSGFAFAQPKAKAPVKKTEVVPPKGGTDTPSRSLFGPNRLRLPLLRDVPKGLATPVPSEQTRKEYAKYIEKEIDVENTLDLVLGRPKILRFKQTPVRIYIPDENVISVQPIGEGARELAVTGKSEGTTAFYIWVRDPAKAGAQKVLAYLVRVIADPERRARIEAVYAALEKEINRTFPNSVVKLSLVGDKLLVRGQAKDVQDATQILRVIGANAPGGPENVPLKNLNLSVLAAQNLDGRFPEGALQDLMIKTAAQDAKIANSSVINMLRIPGEQQVMLKVVVAEVNRSALRSIGANLSIGGNSASFFSFAGAGSFIDPLTTGAAAAATTGGSLSGGRLLVNRGDFRLAINALRSLNLARSLAEPNLVTLNGQPARFQAGGQFPVPQITGFTAAGLQGVQFVPFGVQLQFVPVITDKTRVRLSLSANVSTRDESIGANIGGTGGAGGGGGGGMFGGGGGGGGGTNVAGLNTRNFTTTVELRDGQTLAVAGLIQNNFGSGSNRVPFAGDVPFLGRLFSDDNTSYDEQELVILVTPVLVHPLKKGEQLHLPGADVFEPDDIEFYFKGRIEGTCPEDYRSSARTNWQRMRAWHRMERRLIIGPSGYSDGR